MRLTLPAALTATALACGSLLAAAPATAAPPGNPNRDVIANLFEWNWNSVAEECTTVLGPNGFGGVQVSPPQESASLPQHDHPWWEVYQPVSYQLTSRLGDRAEFAAMVAACDAAGVDVYVDAVINHMTGQNDGGTGYGGSTFPDKYTYDGLYSRQDFHSYPEHCPNPAGEVWDYDNQTEVQNCELLGLADLKTGDGSVRDRIAAYLNDLVSLGVDGFRVDAAKHTPAEDIGAIADRLPEDVYLLQEVIPGGAVQLAPYQDNGDLLEFTYGHKLKEQFEGDIANLRTFGKRWGLQPSEKSVTFTDNHDTERNGSTLSYKDGQAYTLANVFSLAWGYGTPQVYSGYAFTERDESPPAEDSGHVTEAECDSGAWTCFHRERAMLGMVGWHNAAAHLPVRNWWSDGSDVIAFSKGTRGFVTINNSDSPLTRTFATGLPEGTYTDVIGRGEVTVDASGNATITVPAKDAVAIHR